MSCEACELDRKSKGGADVAGGAAENMFSSVCATDSAEPWSVACQHCNAVKADTIVRTHNNTAPHEAHPAATAMTKVKVRLRRYASHSYRFSLFCWGLLAVDHL